MSGKRGAQLKLTDSARKRNKKEANARFNKTKIYIGDQYGRLTELRTKLCLIQISKLRRCCLISKYKHCLYIMYMYINPFFSRSLYEILLNSSVFRVSHVY